MGPDSQKLPDKRCPAVSPEGEQCALPAGHDRPWDHQTAEPTREPDGWVNENWQRMRRSRGVLTLYEHRLPGDVPVYIGAAPVPVQTDALREALEPFAHFCEMFDGQQRGLASRDEDEVYAFEGMKGRGAITLAHLRAARAALHGSKEEE